MNTNNNVSNEKWVEVKYIGKEQPIDKPSQKMNFVYSPSGSICVYFKTHVHKTKKITHKEVKWKVFTFIDLVNKVSYEMKEDNVMVSSFYFLSETEFVIVSGFNGVVKQRIYKLNYIKQTMKLQYAIIHKFTKRDYPNEDEFLYQPTKCVSLDGIDYILLITSSYYAGRTHSMYTMYLIPKYQADHNAPIKEFVYFVTNEEQDFLRDRFTLYLRHNGIQCYDNEGFFDLSVDNCSIRENNLWFNYEFWLEEHNTQGSVIGEYFVIDLTKLKDLSNKEVNDIEELIGYTSDQDSASRLFDNVHISPERRWPDTGFWHLKSNLGTVYVFFKNGSDNAYMTLIDTMGVCTTTMLNCKILNSAAVGDDIDGFSIHPYGALLHFRINNGLICFRVVKSLKTDLEALALNKALFHKNTPIRYDSAYSLCFNRTKPIEYPVKRHTFKRKC